MPNLGKNAQEDDLYKLLVYDAQGQSVISPLMRVQDLRKQGVTLHLRLEAERQNIPDVPAVYLVSPSEKAVAKIIHDLNQVGIHMISCAVQYSSDAFTLPVSVGVTGLVRLFLPQLHFIPSKTSSRAVSRRHCQEQ